MNAPTPPSATATAAAQTASNQATAQNQTELNAIDQNTPTGSLSYSQIGTWPDGTPRFQATSQLTPTENSLLSGSQGIQSTLVGAGQNFTNNSFGTLSSPVNTSNVVPLANTPSYQGYGNGPNLQSSYGSGGSIQNSLPSDYSGDRTSSLNALSGLLQPQLDRQKASLQQQLANQGIQPGTQAYTNAMNDFGLQENNAQLGIIAQSGQEQQLEQNLGLNAANLNNSAQSQANSQSANQAQFGNAASQQQYANQTAAGQLNNANLTQGYQDQNNTNQLSLQNAYNGYNQNLNEALSLAGLQQIGTPQFNTTPSSGVSPTDVSGLINQQYQNQYGQYTANTNALGSIAGTAAGLVFSDRRLKTDIGETGMQTKDGIPVKTFRYKGSPMLNMGVIAQDVERKKPSAVKKMPSGYKAVDYAKIGSPMLRMGAR